MSRGTRNPALVALVVSLFTFAAAASSGLASNEAPSKSQSKDQLKHGEYLVQTVGCGHCHTPGSLYGEFEESRTAPVNDRTRTATSRKWAGFIRNLPPVPIPPDSSGSFPRSCASCYCKEIKMKRKARSPNRTG